MIDKWTLGLTGDVNAVSSVSADWQGGLLTLSEPRYRRAAKRVPAKSAFAQQLTCEVYLPRINPAMCPSFEQSESTKAILPFHSSTQLQYLRIADQSSERVLDRPYHEAVKLCRRSSPLPTSIASSR